MYEPPPRPTRNNGVMVNYKGQIMTYNQMQKEKEINRLVRAGYTRNQARNIVGRYGVANRPSNRSGGMWN